MNRIHRKHPQLKAQLTHLPAQPRSTGSFTTSSQSECRATAAPQPDAPPASASDAAQSTPPEPEAIRTGVIVKTQVAATVYIDNQEAGQTLAYGVLSPGKHRI